MLYQKSVLNKYLNEQNDDTVKAAYEIFKSYFHNTQIQQNIINSKEEQFQEGFLRELFVAVFEYILNPQPDFNITTEFKNEKGSKKADGAVLKDGKAIAVIELKSTKTKDLESIRQQAFDYKANHTDCVYVITSNFQKLRFYINNAVDFEEFDLFSLTFDQFKLLFLCLNSDYVLSNLPLKVKEASILEEEQITKKFYDDYSNFKKNLFENIAKLNENLEGVSKLQLYKKTQKLLDRFLFIFFAEDRNLLPPNSISRMIERWRKLEELDAYKPLYEIYKQYFGYINTGRDGKVPADVIHEYNGGLFLPDELLDRIKIDDDVLLKHTSILTNYDFESQVDVNILGHIFEHSLNEIESTTAKLEGIDFDKQKSKRKKDGVFYTPKYITKYIVDNTIGKLCDEKKAELAIIDEEFTPNRQKDTKRKLLASIETYRTWLLELTICDPACGSGAFLNQALEFLITEHHYIDQLNAQLFASPMVFQDVENQILENNIFGVDINEESVDIARLSLWLRTAQRGRKLTTLNKNIKCGNSLIDDPEVAGDKAFKWEKEFPEVFAKGGFDVVIGNPPYAGRSSSINEEEKSYIRIKYTTSEGKFELYQLFIERCYRLAKSSISLITPQTWLSIIQSTKLRKLVLKNQELFEILFLGKDVFADASVDSIVFIIHKEKRYSQIEYLQPRNLLDNNSKPNNIEYSAIDEVTYSIPLNSNSDSNKILVKIRKNSIPIENIGLWSDGVKVVGQAKSYAFQNSKYDETFFPMIVGKDIGRYSKRWSGLFCCRDKEKIESQNATDIRLRDESMFLREKILIRKTGNEIVAAIDSDNYYYEQSLFSFGIENTKYDLRAILGILNSSLASFLLKENSFSKKETFPQIRLHWLKEFPIPKEQTNTVGLLSKINRIEFTQRNLEKFEHNFSKYLQSQIPIGKLSKKLQNWSELEFGDFIKELNKAIKKAGGEKLSKLDEMEWMEVFETKKAEAQTIKAEIDRTDKEIDQMVYELYGLTEEEIKIVEES